MNDLALQKIILSKEPRLIYGLFGENLQGIIRLFRTKIRNSNT